MERLESNQVGTAMPAQGRAQQMVLLVPQNAIAQADDSDLDLYKLWQVLWEGRWLITTITFAAIVATAVYAMQLAPWYRASVVMAPAKERPAVDVFGQLGGLANLAGISTSGPNSVEAVAILKSKDFAREFINDQSLLPVIFADDWEIATRQCRSHEPPDLRKAVEIFDDEIRRIDEDRRTGLVTLTIEWTEPTIAAP